MSYMLRRRRYSILAVVLVLAAGLGLWLFLSAQVSPPSPPAPVVSRIDLAGVDSETLTGDGFELSVLDPTVQPKTSRDQAQQVALENARPGTSGVRDAVFAHVVGRTYNCPECNAWLFSFDVAPPLLWYVVVVDADTGEFLFGHSRCNSADCP